MRFICALSDQIRTCGSPSRPGWSWRSKIFADFLYIFCGKTIQLGGKRKSRKLEDSQKRGGKKVFPQSKSHFLVTKVSWGLCVFDFYFFCWWGANILAMEITREWQLSHFVCAIRFFLETVLEQAILSVQCNSVYRRINSFVSVSERSFVKCINEW